MMQCVHSAGIAGVEGYLVTVECDLAGGLPGFEVVGLPGAAVKESRERVRAAAKNSRFEFPVAKVIINLAPADIRKEGPVYDLPILMGILAAHGQIPALPEDCVFIGELSLSGALFQALIHSLALWWVRWSSCLVSQTVTLSSGVDISRLSVQSSSPKGTTTISTVPDLSESR